jgi:Salmonella virulence plasmid 65kDa B protein/FG-GAP-like repeat
MFRNFKLNSRNAAAANVLGIACLLLAPNAAYAQGASGLAVTENGVPTFTIPIAVPPGIAGMEPKLALFYSGGGVNGPVGHGWSVQGISAITRCPMTIAVDGRKSRVNYSASDQFCLDGQRLIRVTIPNAADPSTVTAQTNVNGYDGVSGTEYRTEKDSFARIRAYGGNAADGPAYFRVWTKAGQVSDYGNIDAGTGGVPASNSRIMALIPNRATAVMAWAVTRITDNKSNAIDFTYLNETNTWGTGLAGGAATAGREWNISRIDYTRNVNLSQGPTNAVFFNYTSDRPDKAETYQARAKNVSTRRLSSIATQAGAVQVKQYNLTYNESTHGFLTANKYTVVNANARTTNRSVLTSVQECAPPSAGGLCLPPTKLSYSAGHSLGYAEAVDFSLVNERLTSADGKYGTVLGDFNGDGKTDILRYSIDNPSTQNFLWFADPKQQSDGTIKASFSKVANFSIVDKLFTLDKCISVIGTDFNGDGRTDLFRFVNIIMSNGSNICANSGNSILYISNGDGTFTGNAIINVPNLRTQTPTKSSTGGGGITGTTDINWGPGYSFRLVDFDGDGLLDILTSFRAGFYQTNGTATSLPPCSSASPCTVLYRGTAGASGNYSFSAVPDSQSSLALVHTYSEVPYYNFTVGTIPKWGAAGILVDADGAGLQDLLFNGSWNTNGSSSSSWRPGYLSQGTGAFSQPLATTGIPCDNPGFADVNGDGKPDALCTVPSNTSACASCPVSGCPPCVPTAPINKLFMNTGTGTFVESSAINISEGLNMGRYPLLEATTVGNSTLIEILDVNSDGCNDIFKYSPTGVSNGANNLYLSNCDGSFRSAAAAQGFNLSFGSPTLADLEYKTGILTGDFTGRGQIEILRTSTLTTGGTTSNYVPPGPKLPLYPEPEPAFSDPVQRMVSKPSDPSQNPDLWGTYLTAPFTAGTSGNRLYIKSRVEVPDQLVQVVGPTGAMSRIEYQSLAAHGANYNKLSGASYPQVDLQPALWVVSRVWNDAGMSESGNRRSVSTTYGYEGLRGSMNGRGFLGFRVFAKGTLAADGRSLIESKVTSAQNYPYTGLPLKSTTTITTNGVATEVSSAINTYADIAYGGATAGANDCSLTSCAPTPTGKNKPGDTTPIVISKPFLRTGVETGKDLNGVQLPTITTESRYDNWGNPVNVTVTTTGTINTANPVAQTITKTTSNFYENWFGSDQWILGRLKSATARSQISNLVSLPANADIPIPPVGPPSPLAPGVLSAIFQLLLDD